MHARLRVQAQAVAVSGAGAVGDGGGERSEGVLVEVGGGLQARVGGRVSLVPIAFSLRVGERTKRGGERERRQVGEAELLFDLGEDLGAEVVAGAVMQAQAVEAIGRFAFGIDAEGRMLAQDEAAARLQLPPRANATGDVALDLKRFQLLAGKTLAGDAVGPGIGAGGIGINGDHAGRVVGVDFGGASVEATIVPTGTLQAAGLPAPGRGELLDAVIAFGGVAAVVAHRAEVGEGVVVVGNHHRVRAEAVATDVAVVLEPVEQPLVSQQPLDEGEIGLFVLGREAALAVGRRVGEVPAPYRREPAGVDAAVGQVVG